MRLLPDELGADLIKNDVDGDVDGDFTNNTIDIDEDYDGVYDWADVDDDNDGLWDFFEIDSDDDLDNDANQNNGLTSSGLPQFFGGENCVDNDDDGNDADIDGNGFYQPVWDRGILSQGLRSPSYYDVDNDNDGVPDAEDWDDDNNNLSDAEQELIPVVSGEKNNLHLTTIMTAFQIGWMTILMAMDFQIQKNLTRQALLLFSIMIMTD